MHTVPQGRTQQQQRQTARQQHRRHHVETLRCGPGIHRWHSRQQPQRQQRHRQAKPEHTRPAQPLHGNPAEHRPDYARQCNHHRVTAQRPGSPRFAAQRHHHRGCATQQQRGGDALQHPPCQQPRIARRQSAGDERQRARYQARANHAAVADDITEFAEGQHQAGVREHIRNHQPAHRRDVQRERCRDRGKRHVDREIHRRDARTQPYGQQAAPRPWCGVSHAAVIRACAVVAWGMSVATLKRLTNGEFIVHRFCQFVHRASSTRRAFFPPLPQVSCTHCIHTPARRPAWIPPPLSDTARSP